MDDEEEEEEEQGKGRKSRMAVTRPTRRPMRVTGLTRVTTTSWAQEVRVVLDCC